MQIELFHPVGSQVHFNCAENQIHISAISCLWWVVARLKMVTFSNFNFMLKGYSSGPGALKAKSIPVRGAESVMGDTNCRQKVWIIGNSLYIIFDPFFFFKLTLLSFLRFFSDL